MTSSKRPAAAMEAFRLLRKTMPTAQLWMVGSGPDLDALRKSAPAGVTFHGRVDDATKHGLMTRAHVLVVTSVREGWGLVVDEAAAMGTPTVAYDVPGLRDSTTQARGSLVACSPAALAARLREQLPTLVALPAAEGWPGGALGWDKVAKATLDHVARPKLRPHDV